MKKYIVVRSIEDDLVVHKIDITDRNNRDTEVIERGVLRNLNALEYYVDILSEDDLLQEKAEAVADEKKALKIAREAAKTGNIEFVESDKVDLYPDEIDEIMEAMNRDALFISDLSTIGDFSTFGSTNEEKDEYIKNISSALGIEVKYTDYICDIAEKLHKLRNLNS